MHCYINMDEQTRAIWEAEGCDGGLYVGYTLQDFYSDMTKMDYERGTNPHQNLRRGGGIHLLQSSEASG